MVFLYRLYKTDYNHLCTRHQRNRSLLCNNTISSVDVVRVLVLRGAVFFCLNILGDGFSMELL